MSLRKQLEDLEIGGTLITGQNRTGIYVAAKRAKVNVTTSKQPDGTILITKTVWEEKPGSELTYPEYAASIVKNLGASDRLLVFKEFELCCGMNRGKCICPPEEVVVEKPLATRQNALTNGFGRKTPQNSPEIDENDESLWVVQVDPEFDRVAGEWVYYETHPKLGKREIRRETSLEPA